MNFQAKPKLSGRYNSTYHTIGSELFSHGMLLHRFLFNNNDFYQLIVMTFNIWLCIAVVLGEALARALLHLFFPQLDLISETLATSEDCC